MRVLHAAQEGGVTTGTSRATCLWGRVSYIGRARPAPIWARPRVVRVREQCVALWDQEFFHCRLTQCRRSRPLPFCPKWTGEPDGRDQYTQSSVSLPAAGPPLYAPRMRGIGERSACGPGSARGAGNAQRSWRRLDAIARRCRQPDGSRRCSGWARPRGLHHRHQRRVHARTPADPHRVQQRRRELLGDNRSRRTHSRTMDRPDYSRIPPVYSPYPRCLPRVISTPRPSLPNGRTSKTWLAVTLRLRAAWATSFSALAGAPSAAR